MDANNYLVLFVGILVFVAVVSASAGTILNGVAGTWNGTEYVGGLGGTGGALTSTGLGGLFSVTVFGILLVSVVFYVLWNGLKQ